MQTTTDEELQYFWSARATLSESDWNRFYGVVVRALSRCSPGTLHELGEDKLVQVTDFFISKILEKSTWKNAAPYGKGGLCVYFKNYLLDEIRKPENRHRAANVEVEQLEEEVPAESTFGGFDEMLRQTGFTEEAVRLSARTFLSSLDQQMIWLAIHACDENAMALVKTASRLRIASYHYKSLQLGITRKKGEFYAGYDKTLIGRWVSRDLNIAIQPDNMREIFAVLKILCDEALSLCEDVGY